jgi:hypothetical protein
MRYLTNKDSYPVIFYCTRFTISNTKADPETAMLTPVLGTPTTAFKTKMTARQTATDAAYDAQGVVGYRERLLRELVLAVSRKAFAHFASRTTPGYLQILPRSASETLALPQVERKKALLQLQDALAEKGLPTELTALGKDLTVAVKNREAADAGVTTAALAETKAKTAEAAALDELVVAYRALHAQLTLKFPNDKPRVESYFRSPAVKKVAKVVA